LAKILCIFISYFSKYNLGEVAEFPQYNNPSFLEKKREIFNSSWDTPALKFAACDEVCVSPGGALPRGVEAQIEPNTQKNLNLVSLLFL